MFDEKQVRKAITILKPNGQIFEVRVKFKDKSIYSGYFNDADTLIEQMYKLPDGECNMYITLNQLHEACLGRTQSGKFCRKTDATTSDNDVLGYDWLMIDLDPKRPADTSSSDEELEKAKELGAKVNHFMKQIGFNAPVIAMSGNGYHLLYRVNLKRSEENKKLIEKCLKTLDMLFSDEYVAVDTSVFNPARICKLYGTVAEKGKHSEKRPHRMSFIFGDYEDVKVTDRGYLTKLCELYPTEDKPHKYNGYNSREFDVEEWMAKFGITYRKSSWSDGDKYVLDHCPFDHNHQSPDSAIFRSRDGAIGFRCLHNSCTGKTWKDVRVLFEPDAYEKKHKEYEEKIYHKYNRDKREVKPIVEEEGKPVFLTAMDVFNLPKQEESFIKTGIYGIDSRLRGLKKGYVSVWSGLRGASKSTVLSQIMGQAVDDAYNVGCFSGELQPRNFMRWMMLQLAGKNRVEPSQYEGYYNVPREYQEKISKWLGNRFFLYNNEYGNDFVAMIQKFEKLIQENSLDLLVLDNLMAFNISGLDDNKWDAQTKFVWELQRLAKTYNIHICFVAHPRKALGFLRLDDLSGTADIGNAVDDAFIVHRVNNDFRRLTKQMFGWSDDDDIYHATNVIEVAKDRDGGTQDLFIPLWYEVETKRLKNSLTENVIYGWDVDDNGFSQMGIEEETPFD